MSFNAGTASLLDSGMNTMDTIQTRGNSPSNNTAFTVCTTLKQGEMAISRSTFIVVITICVFVTCISMLGLTVLLIREYVRRKEAREAKSWGRKSTYRQRISLVQKEIDDSYTRHYKGIWNNAPENPELGSDSPIEIMTPERIWEAPAVPVKAAATDKNKRRSKLSMFFDHGKGAWLTRG